jgi:lipopolysaccharide transport system permease protein
MSSTSATPSTATIIIEAGRTERRYFADLWHFRELFLFLAWRDVLVRYKQAVIGVGWAFVRPFITMVIFTVIFSKLGKFPSDGMPYPVLVFAAMLPWQFFSSTLSDVSGSLVGNASMISKIYFPRLVVPFSAMAVCFVDFLICFVIMAGLMAWYQIVPPLRILTLPLFIALAVAAAMGFGLWLCVLNVKYRDFRYVVPFVVQLGLYISPVGFMSSIVPEKWRLLYSLNPMVGVIDGFRWAILGMDGVLYVPGLMLSIVISTAALAGGLWYFRKMERTFADVI